MARLLSRRGTAISTEREQLPRDIPSYTSLFNVTRTVSVLRREVETAAFYLHIMPA